MNAVEADTHFSRTGFELVRRDPESPDTPTAFHFYGMYRDEDGNLMLHGGLIDGTVTVDDIQLCAADGTWDGGDGEYLVLTITIVLGLYDTHATSWEASMPTPPALDKVYVMLGQRVGERFRPSQPGQVLLAAQPVTSHIRGLFDLPPP